MKIKNALIIFLILIYMIFPNVCLATETTPDNQLVAEEEEYNPPIYDEDDDGTIPPEDETIDMYGGIPWFATIQFKTILITTIAVAATGVIAYIYIKKKKNKNVESNYDYEDE